MFDRNVKTGKSLLRFREKIQAWSVYQFPFKMFFKCF